MDNLFRQISESSRQSDRNPDRFINKIDENLYLGDYIAATNCRLLKKLGINSIVQVLSKSTLIKEFSSFIEYHKIEIDDLPSEDILQVLPGALAFIGSQLENGKIVLIHCAAGVSRSASIAVAFFMMRYNISYEDALEKVRLGRKCAYPNDGFKC